MALAAHLQNPFSMAKVRYPGAAEIHVQNQNSNSHTKMHMQA